MRRIHTLLTAAVLSVLILPSCCGGASKQAGEQADQTEKTMTKQSDNFIFEADKEWEDAGGGVVRQVMGYNDDIMMVKVKFVKGQEGSLHSHPHSQCTYVASGKFEFRIGDVVKIVEAGDALYKQPGIEHGCVCLEDGLLIDCFSPMRDTFIK